jgi:hypothetical protein
VGRDKKLWSAAEVRKEGRRCKERRASLGRRREKKTNERTNDDGKERREAVGADAGLCDTSTHGAGVAGGAAERPLHSGLP